MTCSRSGSKGCKLDSLLLVDQNVGVFKLGDHFLGIGHKIRADIAAVELHAFDDLELGRQRFGFLNSDHALIADLLHRLGHHAPDFDITIGADRGDLGDLVISRDLPRALSDIIDDHAYGHIDITLQIHRAHAGDHRFRALVNDRLRENRRCRDAVASELAGLDGDLLQHLRADALGLIGELDFLRDRHAVFADPRSAE